MAVAHDFGTVPLVEKAIPGPIISADSHITEPPGTYLDHIDPAFRDRAPYMHHDDKAGDLFIIPGMAKPVPMGLVAAAGTPAEEITVLGVDFADLHRGGWDPDARLAEQDRDGVAGEIIYPTVGMVLCNHDDLDYKHACMQAYNRWIAGYSAAHPDRLFGLGQTAMRTPTEGIADLEAIAAAGLKGVMMPGLPGVEDYDSPIYDDFYQAAVDLGLPLSFHILTGPSGKVRGPKINGFLTIVRSCQDVMGALVFGAVFERHPELRVVCAEADAGWVPHYTYRMDHAYDRHRNWMPHGELSRKPSEYFNENVYVTFQDDWVAFKVAHLMNVERLLWANDFPHSDSTWPWSQEMLHTHTAHLSDGDKQLILHDNVADLYRLPTAATATSGSTDV
ncbi:MAG TPA: amidohydrolase family protein [Acidimicrobiales bacterium]